MDINEEIYQTQQKLSNDMNNLKLFYDILTDIGNIRVFNKRISENTSTLMRISESSEEMDKLKSIKENSEYINSKTQNIFQYINRNM